MAALGCGFAAGDTAAQLLDALLPPGVPGYGTAPGVTVTSRLRPDTDPPGIHAGAFLLRPFLEELVGYDDNVLGGAAKQGSVVVRTQPSLLATSGWSRDAAGLYLAADDRQDLGAPAQSRTDWTVSLGGALDIGRDRLTLAAAHFDRHQDRTELDALPTRPPGGVPGRRRSRQLRVVLRPLDGDAQPGGVVLAFRRHQHPGRAGRPELSRPHRAAGRRRPPATNSPRCATCCWSPAQSASITPPRRSGQPVLDSTGAQALAGFDYDADALWRLRLLAGVEHRAFAAFRSHTAAIAEGEVAWLPTGTTTIAVNLNRSIEDAAQEGVAGFTNTSARLTLDQEVRRNVLLHVSAGVQHADFLQGGTQQNGYAVGAGVTWLASRYVRMSATYDLTAQHGGHVAALPLSGSYTRNQAMLSLRLVL